MTTFRYQALDATGRGVSGTIEAMDRRQALGLLGSRNLFPTEMVEQSKAGAVPLPMDAKPAARNKVRETRTTAQPATTTQATVPGRLRRKDITATTRELATLLKAGIPIPQALESLSEEEENAALKHLLRQLLEAVRKGVSLSEALQQHPKHFDSLYISMVKVGEEGGILDTVLMDLASHLEHEDEIRGEVLGAVAYPVFVLFFGIVTVVVLLTFVLPKMFGMIEDMLDTLPLPTRILLALSDFFGSAWPWLLILVGGISFGLFKYLRTEQGAVAWDTWKLKVPLIGPVFLSAALGRFARTLGTLLKCGVSLMPSLGIVEHTVGNRRLGSIIAQVAEETRGGASLADPLRRLGLFPRTVVQMIHVGEESGKLDEMLLRVAETEERRMRGRTQTLVSLLAPALILGVGAMVGFMVIAILLPIMKMSSSMR